MTLIFTIYLLWSPRESRACGWSKPFLPIRVMPSAIRGRASNIGSMMKDTCSVFWLRRVVRLDQQVISLRRTLSPASLARQIMVGAGCFLSNFLDTQPRIGAMVPQ